MAKATRNPIARTILAPLADDAQLLIKIDRRPMDDPDYQDDDCDTDNEKFRQVALRLARTILTLNSFTKAGQ